MDQYFFAKFSLKFRQIAFSPLKSGLKVFPRTAYAEGKMDAASFKRLLGAYRKEKK